jgi:phosphatidate cytidylyltransferase
MTSHHFPMLQDEAWRLIAAIAAVLIVASVIGQVLKYTLARHGAHAAIDNLNHRINAWWAIAILVGLALLAGRAGVTLLFALASLAALREFVPREAATVTPAWVLRGCFALVLPLQYLLVWSGNPLLYSLFIPACVLLVLPLLGLLSGRPDTFMSHTRSLRAGLLICVFAVSHVPALLTLHLPGPAYSNAYLLVFLLLVVQSSDVFQYLWGKLIGRHLIAPRLSPSKTVEGTVGGILSASALGAGLASLTPFTRREAMLISLLITLLGFLGGLAMSAIKRRRGIKDWGTLIPGHGGMLDRLDSLCLSAPVYYYLLRWGWAT